MDICFDYKLPKDAVVFDVGAYNGLWTEWVRNTYGCPVHTFEPVRAHWKNVLERFKMDPLVFVYDFALSDHNAEERINLSDNSSSLYGKSDSSELIKVRDIWDFIMSFKLHEGRGVIDLLKLNCEGGEMPILKRLLDVGWFG
jgi:FkbM family methyltransferase